MKFFKMFIHVLLIDLVLQCVGYDVKTWEYWMVTFLVCSTYISGYETGKRKRARKENAKIRKEEQ